MFLKNLNLINYRNYDSLSIHFKSKLNFFVGKNASGKTSLLESISLLSSSKSFKETNDKNLVQWKKDNYFIKGTYLKNNIEQSIQIYFQQLESKKKKLN